MRRIVCAVAALFVCSGALAGGMYETVVAVEANERWWGISADGVPWSGQTTPGMPFETRMLVSSNGRYLWSTGPVELVASAGGNSITVRSLHEKVEVQRAGRTLREAYLVCVNKNIPMPREQPAMEFFTRPVYRPAAQPGKVWGGDEIGEYARRITEEGLPAGTIVLPGEWASRNVQFAFQPELFPDPRATLSQLGAAGFGVMLEVDPAAAGSPGRVAADAWLRGWVVETPAPVFDMGNAAYVRSLDAGLKGLRSRYGFAGYSFRDLSPATGDGYSNMQSLAADAPMREIAGPAGGQFDPYVTDIVYAETMSPAAVIDALLASSLSGNIYKAAMCTDSPGDEKARAAFMIMALFFPVASVDRAPWEFGDRTLAAQVKEALLLRATMAGYMEETVAESARTGEPIMRHMEYQFPRQGFADCADQFMLGPRYLVAPCVDGAPRRMVRLPRGRWTDVRTGKTYRGPLVTEVACDGAVCFEQER